MEARGFSETSTHFYQPRRLSLCLAFKARQREIIKNVALYLLQRNRTFDGSVG